MTVAELIEALWAMPQHLEILAEGDAGVYEIQVAIEAQYVLIYPADG